MRSGYLKYRLAWKCQHMHDYFMSCLGLFDVAPNGKITIFTIKLNKFWTWS